MPIQDQFTTEEWNGIIQAPMLAGMAVTAADPGGLWSALKEATGMARSIVEGQKEASADSLVGAVAAAYESSEGRSVAQDGVKALMKGKKPAEASQAAVVRLGEISATVAAKAPAEQGAFKDWIRETAQKVAEAGKEGGFLGFGGVKVSESEKRTLVDIDKALA